MRRIFTTLWFFVALNRTRSFSWRHENDHSKDSQSSHANAMNDLILYTTEDGRSQIKLRAQEQTVWLTQLEMAELFDATKQNISLHLKNVFEDGELDLAATVKESLTVQIEGSREVQRPVTLYNLDAILAVGYRVRSPRGVQFRRWASTILKEYLLKGFVMDDERLKNPDGRPDYFDEMLERIRDIRASEKRFYQKVRDLFVLSSDYDKTDKATHVFFATVQNLLIFAVTRKTAAELITARANPADPHFGLLAWKGDKVRKADIVVAKNYLTEDEIDTLNRLVVIFLETAELRAKSNQETRMRSGDTHELLERQRGPDHHLQWFPAAGPCGFHQP